MVKIVKSLAVIAFVAAIAVGATSSYFSDTEKSVNNTFTAGTIDIELDDADEPFGYDRCAQFTEEEKCKSEPNCKWETSTDNNTSGTCVEINPDSVVGTWDTPDNWNPGDLWNAWISIHNNGTKNIEQLLFRASRIKDSEGLNPESETNSGAVLSEYVYLWGAEQFIWPSEVYGKNPGPVVGGDGVIAEFNDKWGTEIPTSEIGAVDAFNLAVKALGTGNNDFTDDEVRAVLNLIQQGFGVELTAVYGDTLTENFVRVFDSNGNGRADLDEFDDTKTTGTTEEECQKNILVGGEILEPSQVKILILHWKFSEEAGNDLQGDETVADFSVRAVQDGAGEEEVVCGKTATTGSAQ